MPSITKLAAAALVVLSPVVFDAASAGKSDYRQIQKFFGSYVGYTVIAKTEGLSKRGLNIQIVPYEADGFEVQWNTILWKPDGRLRSKNFKVAFLPTKRAGIYAAAARRDLFGHMKPLNPLDGDPYSWAAIAGDTLTLRSLHIGEDGGYEMHVFARKLKKNGLVTHFERVRDGKTLKVIEGELKKVAE